MKESDFGEMRMCDIIQGENTFCARCNMPGFQVNISGRVENFKLPTKNSLIPVLEAIINSMHAIQEKGIKDGKISIEIVRDDNTVMDIGENTPINHIDSFVIVDNGIGFDERNFDSFLTTDSDYKKDLGGKGVGRFAWLKAFNDVDISSKFIGDDGKHYIREFKFSNCNQDLPGDILETDDHNTGTIVKLNGFKKKYKDTCPLSLEVIAYRIVQHCVVYFLNDNCPDIELIDSSKNEISRLNLKSFFEDKIERGNTSEFMVQGHEFQLLHLKFYEVSSNNHYLRFCANCREVEKEDLSKLIVNLKKRIVNGEGKEYFYAGVLTGPYLDDNVDMNRLSFSIPKEKGSGSFINDLSMEEIKDEIKVYIEAYLQEELNTIQKEKEEQIKQYINSEAPQYRHLVKFKSDEVKSIKPSLSKRDLDEALYKIDRELKQEVDDDIDRLSKNLDENSTAEIKTEVFEKFLEKINETGKSSLAKYIVHRKTIISLLEKALRRNEDEKYEKEAVVHEIFFPMRKTSEDVDYFDHNLWMIDERLSYHYYLASDIPFNNSNTERRPDVLICNNPVAMVDTDNSVYSSIVIFELKKPDRNDYSAADNPINQVLDYVDEIRKGKKDKYGRPITVSETTMYYLYIVCDITEKIVQFCERQNLKKTPDQRGYFGVHENYNAYIEVLPFDKIIQDSKQRNKVLFEKLGL